jgi:MannoseP isomerase/GMP-like beta-helix domain
MIDTHGPSTVITDQSAGGIVVPASGRLVACLGVDDLVVVDTSDALLITTRARSQEVMVPPLPLVKVSETLCLLPGEKTRSKMPRGRLEVDVMSRPLLHTSQASFLHLYGDVLLT